MRTGACPSCFGAAPMGRRDWLRAGWCGPGVRRLPQLSRAEDCTRPWASTCIHWIDWGRRFVEEAHGQGAGCLGLPYEPMRIDADASKPGYQVMDVALHADVPRERSERRRALLRDLDRQVQAFDRLQSEGHDAHYEQ